MLEASVDFDWAAIEADVSGSLNKDSVEDMKQLLLFLASYIFVPHPSGGKRSDREQVIATKALASFAYILENHMGGDAAGILRASGLKVTQRNFTNHIQTFHRFVVSGSVRNIAIQQLQMI